MLTLGSARQALCLARIPSSLQWKSCHHFTHTIHLANQTPVLPSLAVSFPPICLHQLVKMLFRTTRLLRRSPPHLTTFQQSFRAASSNPKLAKSALVYKGRIPRAEPTSTTSASSSSDPATSPTTDSSSSPTSATLPAAQGAQETKDTLGEAYKLPKIPGVQTGLGARLGGGEKDQRKKYRYAESRIVRAMCAAPIAIVLTVVLYQRCECCPIFPTSSDRRRCRDDQRRGRMLWMSADKRAVFLGKEQKKLSQIVVADATE